MGADFLTHHVPKSSSKYGSVSAGAGGVITSQYGTRGLKTQHQISSDGHINAQAEIE